jgi:hypothetical protein
MLARWPRGFAPTVVGSKENRQLLHEQICKRRAALGAALVMLVLAGCASDPRYQHGVEWVVSQEAEKKRLNDAGFPQYTGAP